MYINITGSSNNKDVYIYQSFRKENGKTSSHIYKKLGKMNDLLAQIDNDKEKMMEWARNEAKKETELYNQKNGKVSVDFSQGARIMKNEQRLFNVGYSSEARGQSGVFLSCFLFLCLERMEFVEHRFNRCFFLCEEVTLHEINFLLVFL